MIGMVGEDRDRPEQLFGKHCARQHVRPGRGTEGQQQVGGFADLLAMAIRDQGVEAVSLTGSQAGIITNTVSS